MGDLWIAESVLSEPYTAGPGAQRIRKFSPRTGLVSTIAGSSIPGSVDGLGASARFRGPCAFAFARDGSVFVADRLNHRIRRINPQGVVSTYAGSSAGLKDGPVGQARFFLPMGLGLDSQENLYVADFGNSRVRRISPAGDVKTVAGSTAGFVDGARNQARFSSPSDLAVLADDTILVADWANGAVRRLFADGRVQTLLLDLGYVERLAADARGRFYVTHARADANGRIGITEFNLDGDSGWEFSPVIGLRDGPAAASYFSSSLGGVVCRTDGALWIADVFNHSIRAIQLLDRVSLEVSPGSGLFTNRLEVTARLATPTAGVQLRYTTDGSAVLPESRLYGGPLSFESSVTVRVRAFSDQVARSPEEQRRFDRVYALPGVIPTEWWGRYFGAGYLTDPRTPADADPDNDGYTNLQEYYGATDPLDSKSFPFEQTKPLDFDGDGRADLLLQHDEGFLAAWHMDGDVVVNAGSLDPASTGDPGLRLVGVGDFNRDSKPDLLFQRKSGRAAGSMEIWIMAGVRRVETIQIEDAGLDPDWNAVGVGDYDFDGRPDVVGQRVTGELVVKFIQGARVVHTRAFNPAAAFGADGTPDLNWRLVGNADINRDGRMDLIFQRVGGFSRPIAIWFMNGLDRVSASLTQPSDPGGPWNLAGTGDFDGDGWQDFLFQNDNGNYGIWFLNGINRIQSAELTPSTAGPGWRIAGPR